MADHVCPVWVGWLLLSPIRKLTQNPAKILGPYIKDGMTVVDVGCAMGFFSIPMAKMVGKEGRVLCVDVQEKMLRSLRSRAQKAKVSKRIETILCENRGLGLDDYREKIDFAFAFAVVHETPEPSRLFSELYDSLKPDSCLLLSEPKGHVTVEGFEKTVLLAIEAGFAEVSRPSIHHSVSALLQKKS